MNKETKEKILAEYQKKLRTELPQWRNGVIGMLVRYLEKILNALPEGEPPSMKAHPPEEIGNELRLGEWCFVDCECRHCKRLRKEITKRMIDEFLNMHSEQGTIMPEETLKWFFSLGYWLEKED